MERLLLRLIDLRRSRKKFAENQSGNPIPVLYIISVFPARILPGRENFLAAYLRRLYAPSVGEFKGVSRHWKVLLGCGVLTLIVLVYTLRYHSAWPLIIWVILVACLFAATFRVWHDKK